MSTSGKEPVRILYIGQKARVLETLQKGIEEHHCEVHGSIGAHEILELTWIKNQKVALNSTRKDPANIVLVEMDGKRNRRLSFCEMLRYRLPKAAIIAARLGKLNTSFTFDGEFKIPKDIERLDVEQIVEYLCELATKFNGNLLERGHIQLNIAKRTVTVNEERYPMTPKQCALLNMFLNNHGEVVTRENIMREIWETSFMEDTRTLDVHIRWLRERIEKNPSKPKYLVTVRRVGYKLEID